MSTEPPLVVDLDGTLLRVDTLHELLVRQLRSPIVLIRALVAGLRGGKARLKAELARSVSLDVATLPVNQLVFDFAEVESKRGRQIVLATGADSRIAAAAKDHFRFIDSYFASDGTTNLTAERKAEKLVDEFGSRGFDYIGNAPADLEVWRHARRSILAAVGTPGRLAHQRSFDELLVEPALSSRSAWLKQIRIHQSAKNLLLFLPLIAAHQVLNLGLLALAALGFVVFTMMASAVYILNDLLDLDADRSHRKKRFRPLASGRISPLLALLVGFVLSVGALTLAATIGVRFFTIVLLYAVLTLSYSWILKRITIVDVITLALLYMIRILAGAVITRIDLSFWFVGVTLFLFLSLALVKRYAEVSAHTAHGAVPGRGYRSGDEPVILALGVGSGIAAILLLAIYIQSDAVRLIYAAPELLWLTIPIVFFWFAHLWIVAARGEMHEDPVLFALRDKASLLSGAFLALLFILATVPVSTALIGVFSGTD